MKVKIPRDVDTTIIADYKLATVFHKVLECESEHDQEKEHFWVVALTTRNTIKNIELVSLGTLNESLVHPREVFRLAIMQGANSIILCHNHPSGDSTPSEDDHKITQRLVEAGKLLGIKVLDHIIIGNNGTPYGFTSFISRGWIA